MWKFPDFHVFLVPLSGGFHGLKPNDHVFSAKQHGVGARVKVRKERDVLLLSFPAATVSGLSGAGGVARGGMSEENVIISEENVREWKG